MKTIRIHLLLFMVFLALSGITAFPLQTEIGFLFSHMSWLPAQLQRWIDEVNSGMITSPQLMYYGTDWLAFAHLVIALFFIPVYLYPQKYKLNLIAGMTGCAGVFLLAFICGPIRGIPFFHQLIDRSFGLLGFLYLLFILHKTNHLPDKQEIQTFTASGKTTEPSSHPDP